MRALMRGLMKRPSVGSIAHRGLADLMTRRRVERTGRRRGLYQFGGGDGNGRRFHESHLLVILEEGCYGVNNNFVPELRRILDEKTDLMKERKPRGARGLIGEAIGGYNGKDSQGIRGGFGIPS